MKAKLILLDTPIIVSDEEIKAGDFVYDVEQKDTRILHDKRNETGFDKKVLSHSKQIDYNGIDFGVVDVEKLAIEEHKYNHKSVNEISFRLGFIEGFKASQQLNEKKFTLEDIKTACRGFTKGKTIDSIIKSLSLPKTYDIEIEETDTHIKILKKI